MVVQVDVEDAKDDDERRDARAGLRAREGKQQTTSKLVEYISAGEPFLRRPL